MNKKIWAVIISVMGWVSYYLPNWNGFFMESSYDVTSGDGHVIAAIFFVGALLLWYLPEDKS